jgi:hypothetical protein
MAALADQVSGVFTPDIAASAKVTAAGAVGIFLASAASAVGGRAVGALVAPSAVTVATINRVVPRLGQHA